MIYEGNCRFGDLFRNRRERGRKDLPVLSVTMDEGLVDRSDLDRKQESNLTPEEHILVKPGDIAYNMMRMWQGSFGLAEREGMVSPAYVVLSPTNRVDPVFASYLLRSPRVRYLLWAYSYGITDDRLRLYYSDFSKIPAYVPSLSRQRKIGECLATWDAAITVTEKLIRNSQLQKTAVVESLVSPPKSARTKGWLRTPIGKIATVTVSSVNKKHAQGERAVRLCNYTDVYKNDHITSDMTFMEATASDSEIKRFSVQRGDVLVTKDSESPDDIAVPACVSEDIPGLVCGYHLAIVRPDLRKVDPEFLTAFFLLRKTRRYFLSRANGARRFGLPVSALEDAHISLPSLAEQQRASQTIKTINLALRHLTRQLELLNAQKDGLLSRLIPQSAKKSALQEGRKGR